jgi:hypothetical protein
MAAEFKWGSSRGMEAEAVRCVGGIMGVFLLPTRLEGRENGIDLSVGGRTRIYISS